MQRRSFFLLLGSALAGLSAAQAANSRLIEVWKSPTCGCCEDWLRHLAAGGFRVKVHEVGEAEKAERRSRLGLTDRYASCHTGLVQGYIIEGHVPARDIYRLLQAQPQALGLAVPGMPIGSPGMDGPEYGGRKDPYDVLLVQRNGAAAVFQSYR